MLQMTPETQFLLAAVRQAAWLIKQVESHLAGGALTKGDKSPVTVADFASQAVVARLLAQHFPQDVLVAEESAAVLRQPENADLLAQIVRWVREIIPAATAEEVCEWIDRGAAAPGKRFWVLDPIDGTKGFLRGDQYVVALALVEDGQVVLSGLGCPNLNADLLPEKHQDGAQVVAARGQGAWVMPLSGGLWRQIHVSNVRDLTQVRVLRSFEAAHTDGDKIAAFARALGTQAEPVRMDSQAKYAMLAGGSGEVVLRLLSPKNPNYQEKIWDQAAGALIVEEAGGKITDLSGQPLDFSTGRLLVNNRGVLASNGWLHDDMLAALQKIGA